MRKERLGFKYDGGLIVKSPETGIAAKVQLSEDRTPVAYLLNWIDEINLEMKAIEEEKILDKNKIISVMLLFYLVITGLCICLSNVVVGIIASLFFIATTIDKCYFFLPKIIYSIKNKEEAQYANILRKADICYSRGLLINAENIMSVKPSGGIIKEDYMRKIIQAIEGIVLTPVILIAPHVDPIVIILIDIGIFIFICLALKKGSFVRLSVKINELLEYRKPTEEQIDKVLFGFNFLRKIDNMSDKMKYRIYFH